MPGINGGWSASPAHTLSLFCTFYLSVRKIEKLRKKRKTKLKKEKKDKEKERKERQRKNEKSISVTQRIIRH